MEKFTTLLFFYLVVSAHTELICYDCDPTSPGKCISPSQVAVKTTTCDEVNGHEQIGTPECFTIEYQTDDPTRREKSGIYRGCFAKMNEATCIHLNQTFAGKVTWCNSCAKNKCNL